MKSYNQSLIISAFAFLLILGMGIYMKITDYGSYQLPFTGRGGSSSGPMDGNSLIFIAVLFGAIMVWAHLAGRNKR